MRAIFSEFNNLTNLKNQLKIPAKDAKSHTREESHPISSQLEGDPGAHLIREEAEVKDGGK